MKKQFKKYTQQLNVVVLSALSYIQFVDASVLNFLPPKYVPLAMMAVVMLQVGLGAKKQKNIKTEIS